jgi:hypothetical protein
MKQSIWNSDQGRHALVALFFFNIRRHRCNAGVFLFFFLEDVMNPILSIIRDMVIIVLCFAGSWLAGYWFGKFRK